MPPALLGSAALVALAGLALAAAPPPARAEAVRFRRVDADARAADPTALAVDPRTGRLALGSSRGVLVAEGRGFAVALRGSAVRDLAWLPPALAPAGSGALLVAGDAGLLRVTPAGGALDVGPAPGARAREVLRVAVTSRAAAVATRAGVFLSRDAVAWQRLAAGLPLAPASALALRERGGLLEVWAGVGGGLWLARVETTAAGFALLGSEELRPGVAVRDGGAVDLVLDLRGADAVAVFPRALALRRAPGASWQVVRPALPPGARMGRLAAALGRLWLATDRGLLVADRPQGPWRRAAAPAGGSGVRALAGGPAALFAATRAGLLSAAPAEAATRDAGSGTPGSSARGAPEPAVGEVHRVAVEYLDLQRSRLASLRAGLARRGWLPSVVLRAGHDRLRDSRTTHDQTFSSGAVRHLVDRDRDRGEDFALDLTLSWDLGDLAYHPEVIDVAREAREVIELRDDVLDEITQLYFERRRVLAELAALEDARGPEAAALRRRADELAAGIDAWTGGWFGRRVPALSAPARSPDAPGGTRP